jgi:hypothetical protein
MIGYGIDVIDPGRNMDHKQYSGSKAIEPGRNRDRNVMVIPAREDEKS